MLVPLFIPLVEENEKTHPGCESPAMSLAFLLWMSSTQQTGARYTYSFEWTPSASAGSIWSRFLVLLTASYPARLIARAEAAGVPDLWPVHYLLKTRAGASDRVQGMYGSHAW